MNKNLILLLVLILLNASLLNSSDGKRSFLMGSVVKSKVWEVDRKNNLEYFRDDVYFRNREYLLKSDRAVYNHNNSVWNVEGNVYCKKKNDDYELEMYCDKMLYDEIKEFAVLNSTEYVKINYSDNKTKYKAFAKIVEADNKGKKMIFKKDFKLYSSSITVYSDYAVYYDVDKKFVIENKPSVRGRSEDYKIYIQSEKMFFYRIEELSEFYGKVYGIIIPDKKEKI